MKLPREDNKSFEFLFDRHTLSYAPGFSTVVVTQDMIKIRVPYAYNYRKYHKTVKLKWAWLKTRFVSKWELEDQKKGTENIGFDTRFGWNTNWNFSFNTTPIPPKDKLAKFLAQGQLQSIASEIDRELAKQMNVRNQFEQFWSVAARPVQLPEGMHLMIAPADIWVGPIVTDGSSIQSGIGFSGRPELLFSNYPSQKQIPLPPFRVGETNAGDIKIVVKGRLGFKDAAAVLRNRLSTIELPTAVGKVRVKDVMVSGLNDSIILGVFVTNRTVSGWVYLSGKMEYRKINQTVFTETLEVDVRSRNPLVQLFGAIFGNNFEELLKEYSYWQIGYASLDAMKTMSKAFNEATREQIQLQMLSIEPFTSENAQMLFTDSHGFIVALQAKGRFVVPE